MVSYSWTYSPGPAPSLFRGRSADPTLNKRSGLLYLVTTILLYSPRVDDIYDVYQSFERWLETQ